MGYELIFYECYLLKILSRREKESYFGAHFFDGSFMLTGEVDC